MYREKREGSIMLGRIADGQSGHGVVGRRRDEQVASYDRRSVGPGSRRVDLSLGAVTDTPVCTRVSGRPARVLRRPGPPTPAANVGTFAAPAGYLPSVYLTFTLTLL